MGLSRGILEQQNKDLRIQKDNLKIKLEIAGNELKAAKEEFSREIKEKDRIIATLQIEIATLTQKLEMQEQTMQERIEAMVTAAVEQAVSKATAPLIEELSKSHIEIARLKAIINKDSSNSSKPSSKNGFKKIPNSREASGQKKGGQFGHPGHRLTLPKNIDELVETGKVRKQVIDLAEGSSEYISRYVIDFEIVTTLTEYRFAMDARLPEHLYNEVSYGDCIKAVTVLFLNEGIVAEKRLSDMVSGLTQGILTPSPASLEHFQRQFAEKLEESGNLDSIKTDLLNGDVMHTDDTPMRCMEKPECQEDGEVKMRRAEKGSLQATIRTHSNAKSTLYTVNPQKNMEGVTNDDILPRYHGILSHDHESKFYNYGTQHATCCEHLQRDLKGLRELSKIAWAEEVREFFSRMNKHKNSDLSEDKTECDRELLEKFEREYDQLLERGYAKLAQMEEGNFGYNEFRKMLNRLSNHKDSYLLFIHDYRAPFTNNLAERDLRPEKTKEKISLLFQSWEGIKRHTIIRSFISTVKKREKDIFESIVNAYKGVNVLLQ